MDEPGAVAASRRWSNPKRFGVAALALVVATGALAGADALFHLRPMLAEAMWRAALASPIPPLQHEAIRALRQHATRGAAVSLVAFINARSRSGDLEPAVRATETLCLLSGRSFGASFQQCRAGRAWAKAAADEWPEVLERINAWAASAFGPAR